MERNVLRGRGPLASVLVVGVLSVGALGVTVLSVTVLSTASLACFASVAGAQTLPATRSNGAADTTHGPGRGTANGAGDSSGRFRPPTMRAVSRPFDMRNGTYGAGNRGLDYAVQPGDPIRVIGGGTVVFAGVVAGQRFVTVLHPDGLRSSYSYLATISVTLGATVSVGDLIGSSSARFQLGVRRGAFYIDPAPLLSGSDPPTRARLVRGARV